MKGFRIATLCAVALLASACLAETSQGASETRAAKPHVVCLKYSTGNFFYGKRPSRCDYYDGRAPEGEIIGLAVYPTRKVRWPHWGFKTANGRGQYHVTGGWLKAKIRLRRPRTVCGKKVFTRVQMSLKIPGEGWNGWGRKTPIKTCR